MKTVAGVAIVLIALMAIAIPNFHTALQRSKQKRTLADMRTFVKQLEARKSHVVPRDAWGNAMRVKIAGSHYILRAAAADGKFETSDPVKPTFTNGWGADMVIVDGRYMQYPEGICAGDEPGKGPLGDCMSCHPHHIARKR